MASIHNEHNPLGQATQYVDQYDASLLFPIARNESWEQAGRDRNAVTFYGEDIWNGYEVSWLLPNGKPQVALAEFRVAASTPYLIESKSFKLYLNSFNQTVFESAEAVRLQMQTDLSRAYYGLEDDGLTVAGVNADLKDKPAVSVVFYPLDHTYPTAPHATCLDELDVTINHYEPNPELLTTGDENHNGWVCSHLLKSNCPVTGQPDWGSVYIHYTGKKIDEAGLLAYVVSLRQHQDFHEHCVERTFHDISQRCKPQSLIVYARYVRRGGLDINPYRSSDPAFCAENFMLNRQ